MTKHPRSRPTAAASYGPDLVDRWKARAFQQDPGVGDAVLRLRGGGHQLGRLEHPARRARRPGARDPRDLGRRLRHQRDPARDLLPRRDAPEDLAARARDPAARRHLRPVGLQRRRGRPTFYNSAHPDGVPVDGRNDEVFGNFDDPATRATTATTRATLDQTYRSAYARAASVTPTSSRTTSRSTCATRRSRGQRRATSWTLVTGPNGTIVDRYRSTKPTDLTPGGAAQSLPAVPYYRDDSCFDDGTGTDPGPAAAPALGRRAAHDRRRRRRASAGRPTDGDPTERRPLLPGLDRDARPPPPVPSPTPTTPARRSR